MGGLFDSPDPPNPIATAGAQTGTNVSTAVANANLGNVNQVTPQGNLTYATTGNFDWTDPTTGRELFDPAIHGDTKPDADRAGDIRSVAAGAIQSCRAGQRASAAAA